MSLFWFAVKTTAEVDHYGSSFVRVQASDFANARYIMYQAYEKMAGGKVQVVFLPNPSDILSIVESESRILDQETVK
jgi:hypothetical protein